MTNSYAQLLPSSSFQSSPWKNGGGITREIALFPPNSSLGEMNFLWRLSTAKVEKAGDFSLFPGFDRLLTLIQGKEMILSSSAEMRVLRPGEIFRFSGNEQFRADLPRGPITDLGLIFRPDLVSVEMKVLQFGKRARSLALNAPNSFFIVVEGEFAISCFPGEWQFSPVPGDVLQIHELPENTERIVHFEPCSGSGTVIGLEIG